MYHNACRGFVGQPVSGYEMLPALYALKCNKPNLSIILSFKAVTYIEILLSKQVNTPRIYICILLWLDFWSSYYTYFYSFIEDRKNNVL